MKRLLSILLAVCFCLTACSTPTPEPSVSTPEKPKNYFFDYDTVIEHYKNLAQAKKDGKPAPVVDTADFGEQDKKVLATLEYVADAASNITVLGYGYPDLNKDGKDELLLTTSTGRIYAIFTQNASGVVALCGQKGDIYGIDEAGWIYSYTRMEQADLVRDTYRRMYLHGESLQGEVYSKTSRKLEDGSVDNSCNRTVNGKTEEIQSYQFQTFYDEYFGMSYGVWMRTKAAGVYIHRLFPEKKDTDGSLGQADFSTYEKVLDTYKKIVSLYRNFDKSKWLTGEYDNLFVFASDADYTIYTRLLRRGSSRAPSTEPLGFTYPESGDNAYGYSYSDLDGDGKNELALITDQYEIIAIFTEKNGKAALWELPTSGSYLLWTDGKIRTDASSTHILQYGIYAVKDGKAVREEYVTYDGVVYLREKEGKLEELARDKALKYYNEEFHVSDLPAEVCNRMAGLAFVPLFGKPVLGEEYLHQWTQMAYINGISLTVTEVKEGQISFDLTVGDDGKPYETVQITAHKDGDVFVFDTQEIAGSLELGVGCIWLHVTKSIADHPAVGSHLLDYYRE